MQLIRNRAISSGFDNSLEPRSISDPQEVLPLAKLALEAHALGDLECRDHAPLDLLAGLAVVKASA